ncbi:flavin monoamine oxidase family protein [Rhodopirellula sallentina]|uniref:Twin-arginine translocation pathway signal n=1 Tax=Rhodopirellula sallentina SM41 TaxID=1263870 RepID=M5TW33_9BACT|nr:FAD-dependent oxidoreductase [Rhodopirellula sallentina]EMI53239.1 twin-arginine translocation pathway signal [Rhodopirellula sallentina SM41]
MNRSDRESPVQSGATSPHEPLRYSRRQLMEMVFGSAATASLIASGVGCGHLDKMFAGTLPPSGELLTPNHQLGHRLREPAAESAIDSGDASPQPAAGETKHHQCVIIGAGASGLSAARHLLKSGIDDFVVLELEQTPGGTSRSGQWSSGEGDDDKTNGGRFPWGAHYLPVPMADNRPLVDFLIECDVLQETDDRTFPDDRTLIAAENFLCREPEERVFANGQWHAGLFPFSIATEQDQQQLARFRSEMAAMAQQRGDDGKRLFAIPCAESSEDTATRELDRISMSDWLSRNEFDSPLLAWLVDYACRDDYGLHADQTSAWAGLFYFAARVPDGSDESQPVLTWPEGNGFLIDRLCESVGDRLQLGKAVMRVARVDAATDASPLTIDIIDAETNETTALQANHVIVAVPQFIASKILSPELARSRPTSPTATPAVFSYGSWLVANVYLSGRPAEAGFPMSWDNVVMESGSLGYVNSVHQTGRDHGPTVLTWYQALPDDVPAELRVKLLGLTWAEAAETVLSDLELAHPDIRGLVNRLDVMVWGHAMPQPRVGTLFDPVRRRAAEPIGNVHFACTDLTGLALFEEAFAHGHRAATEVIDATLDPTTSIGFVRPIDKDCV